MYFLLDKQMFVCKHSSSRWDIKWISQWLKRKTCPWVLLIDDLWIRTVCDISFSAEDLPTLRDQTLASVYLV